MPSRTVRVKVGNIPRTVPRAFAEAAGARCLPIAREGRTDVLVPEAWIEFNLPGTDWTAAALMLMQAGAPVVGELRVRPRDHTPDGAPDLWRGSVLGVRAACPAGGITHRVLRRLPLGVLTIGTERFTQAFAAEFGADALRGLQTMGLAPDRSRAARAPRPRTRRRIATEVLAGIALVYSEVVADPKQRRRALEAMREQTFPEVTAKRLQVLVREARRQGLLEPASAQGAPGGRLTPLGAKLAAPLAEAIAPSVIAPEAAHVAPAGSPIRTRRTRRAASAPRRSPARKSRRATRPRRKTKTRR
jgi:hypothetical protein